MSAPYIPATALGGDLVRDWTGPAEQRNEMDDDERTEFWSEIVLMPRIQRSRPSVVVDGLRYATNGWSGDIAPDFVHLDPRRPEVAHRIADVLRAKGHEVGHLLPVALGGRQGDVIAEEQDRADDPCSAHAVGVGELCSLSRPCPVARGTPQRTIRRAIPAADVSALTLAASVSGVEAGRGVVRGVLGEWHTLGHAWGRSNEFVLVYDEPRGWQRGWRIGYVGQIIEQGPETGPEGRAAADAAVHAAGWARLDPAAPFGVVVPTFDLENER